METAFPQGNIRNCLLSEKVNRSFIYLSVSEKQPKHVQRGGRSKFTTLESLETLQSWKLSGVDK